ncbi:ABC transporter ATP-binding protein [Opitutaceae bacterium]|nr:ABC transporter ATP-binding protein [Opitutaceae bacterium]
MEKEEFWALSDLNFSIEPGEVVGIIGRNGAGKSTLLKILSRITEPTTGSISLRGRVASLLEVGTGFHPELSGRENIFLNGAILGMSRSEIRMKFDEIVEFAEVERFLDTPVKRYSSGMYVRLAFAVAAHLEPEILIVDEVLAVGDATFQKKCLGKMQEVAKTGERTVLFVSHNMSVMLSLCQRALFLEEGQLKLDSNVQSAVSSYLSNKKLATFERPRRKDTAATITFASLEVKDDGESTALIVDAKIDARNSLKAAFEVRVTDQHSNATAFGTLGTFKADEQLMLNAGEQRVKCVMPLNQLANGSYGVNLRLTLPFQEDIDQAENLLSIDLELSPSIGQSHRIQQNWGLGCIHLPLTKITSA